MMAVISLWTFAFDIPPKPEPNRLVNDYIGLLRPQETQALESRLVAFNNTTSIQIAVVIMDDLGGEEAQQVATDIGQKWGVGQKGIDNGIIFLIVKYSENAREKYSLQKHGDWFIATGYGLEPYITDLEAKQIGETRFIPYAREDRYFVGIDETIVALMESLGEIGWQQRQELEAQRKAKKAEDMHNFVMGVLGILLLGLIIGLIIWAIHSYKAAEELKKRKQALKKSFDEADAEYLQLLLKIPGEFTGYPLWAMDQHTRILKDIDDKIEPNIKWLESEFSESVETNMVDASEIIGKLREQNKKLASEVNLLLQIPKEIKKYQDDAPQKIIEAKDVIQKIKSSVVILQVKGYLLPEYPILIDRFTVECLAIEANAHGNQVDHKKIYEDAQKLSEEINSFQKQLDIYLASQKNATDIIKKLDFIGISKTIALTQGVVDEMKAQHPKANWEDVEKDFLTIPTLLEVGKKLQKSASDNNSMTVQKFTEAEKFAQQAEERQKKILSFCANVNERSKDISDAKRDYDVMVKEAQQQIAKAKTKTSDSDVEQSAKTKLSNATKKLEEAKSKTSESLIDWLLVSALLASAKTMASEAYTQAVNDIDEAEAARRRRREEEAEAAAEAEAASKRRSEESNYSYSSHSYSSDSGSSSNSISFGGGSFGGGGAGGSW